MKYENRQDVYTKADFSKSIDNLSATTEADKWKDFVNPFPRKYTKPKKWRGFIPWEEYIDRKYKRLQQIGYEQGLIYHYGAVRCHNRHKLEDVTKFETKEEIDAFRKKVKQWNKKVRIPKRRSTTKWEWLILSRPQIVYEHHNETVLPDEIGRMVRVTTKSVKWETMEKIPILLEMTYYMLGESPLIRYNIDEIEKTYINMFVENHEFVRIGRYHNKVIIEYDTENPKVVVCGDAKEANMLLYNMMRDYRKCPYAMISEKISPMRKEALLQRILETTGVEEKILNRPRSYK